MASIPMVLQRVKRARREAKQPPSVGKFPSYEATYEEILAAVESAGGEALLDDVGAWAVEQTKQKRRLPTPKELRAHARGVLGERGIDIPDELQAS